MVKRTKKHAFTVVEIVIIVAVVAILAAALIPTYVKLAKKANEATALAEAKSLVTEMLANILDGGDDAADLLVISKKGGAVYAHAYSAKEARVLQFVNNPILEKTTDNFEEDLKNVIEELTKGAFITPVAIYSESWRTDENLVTILETMDMDVNQTRVYARFKIEKAFGEIISTECTHEHTEKEADIAPTCTEYGYNGALICSDCGKVLEPRAKDETKKPLGHNYVLSGAKAATCTEDGFTGGEKCSRCGDAKSGDIIKAAGHSFGDWKVTTAATCTAKGTETRTCSKCNTQETKEIAMTSHTAGNDWVILRDASCRAAGEKAKKCSICGKVMETAEIASLSHTWSNERVIKEATCAATGVKEHTCAVCGVNETEIIEKTNVHTEVVDAAVEPTCETAGKTEGKHCSVCGKVTVEQKEVAALGHKPEKVEGKAATCKETGLTDGEKCSVCNKELKAQEEIAIDPENHASYGDWRHVSFADFFDKKMSFAIAERQCTACGEYEDLYINASIELPADAKCGTKVTIKYKCLFEVREDGSIVEGGHACGHEWTEERYLTHDYDESGVCTICGGKKS